MADDPNTVSTSSLPRPISPLRQRKDDVQLLAMHFLKVYADKNNKPDRLNFGGRHVVGVRCPPTGLTLRLVGYDATTGEITDAKGQIALVSDTDEVAASWSFKKILEHWSRKHAQAVYVPSKRQTEPNWQYAYGHKVRLAQGTDSLRLLRAFAAGAMYYDPGIKVLAHGHQRRAGD